jgi:hypothetical protein
MIRINDDDLKIMPFLQDSVTKVSEGPEGMLWVPPE